MSKHTTLPTQLEAGLARWERPLRAAAKRAAWAQRLDPAAYSCTRSGRSWLAECAAAGQVFEFSRDDDGNITCLSGSGATYTLTPDGDGWRCGCPCGTAGKPDKHLAGLTAVFAAARAEKRVRELALVTVPTEVAA